MTVLFHIYSYLPLSTKYFLLVLFQTGHNLSYFYNLTIMNYFALMQLVHSPVFQITLFPFFLFCTSPSFTFQYLFSNFVLLLFKFSPHLHLSSFPQQDINQSYWNDLITIVQDELRRLRQRDAASIDLSAHHRQGIHAAVASDVSTVFINKSVAELNQLQRNIESKLAGPTTGLDIGYWESLLSQLRGKGREVRVC